MFVAHPVDGWRVAAGLMIVFGCLAKTHDDDLSSFLKKFTDFQQEEALRAAATKCSRCDSLSPEMLPSALCVYWEQLNKDSGAQTNTKQHTTSSLMCSNLVSLNLLAADCWGHRINRVHLRGNMKINIKNKMSTEPLNWWSRNLHTDDPLRAFLSGKQWMTAQITLHTRDLNLHQARINTEPIGREMINIQAAPVGDCQRTNMFFIRENTEQQTCCRRIRACVVYEVGV